MISAEVAVEKSYERIVHYCIEMQELLVIIRLAAGKLD
jgi:hypothetical protein